MAVGLPEGDRIIERPYSIVSAPHEGELEFFLELVPGGQLTPLLYPLPVGGVVYLRRTAKGPFLSDSASGHSHHLMAATVTGAAPFVSMLRHFAFQAAAGAPMPHRILRLHAARDSRELAYCAELPGYQRQHAWFRYVPTVSRVWTDPSWTGERAAPKTFSESMPI